MLVLVHIFSLVLLCNFVSGGVSKFGPRYKPSGGEIWPKPAHQTKKDSFYTFSGNPLAIVQEKFDCSMIRTAEDRFHDRLGILYKYADPRADVPSKYNKGMIEYLLINLTNPCEESPHFNMIEKYTLDVRRIVRIHSPSVWGIIRGLESLLQSFYIYQGMLVINHTVFTDEPAYKHRGLMLDTARHYITMSNIMLILDAMAINKMNVLHWHIVDDESFPLVSRIYPKLSEKGAFYPDAVYNSTVVKTIIQYAGNLGIRVIPEISMPGHTGSFAKSHPELLSICYDMQGEETGFGPMHPVKKSTYYFLAELWAELQILFPDQYVHLGANDVNKDCWSSDLAIKHYVYTSPNVNTIDDMCMFFLETLRKYLKTSTKYIVWEDVLDFIHTDKENPNHVIVQLYKKDSESPNRGFKTIYSVPWDLGKNLYMRNKFESMYLDGAEMRFDSKHIGGEAILWGNKVDNDNIISSVWSLASAVAEVLWNPKTIVEVEKRPNDTKFQLVYERLAEHTCRMIRFGIPASPVAGPGSCKVIRHRSYQETEQKMRESERRKMLNLDEYIGYTIPSEDTKDDDDDDCIESNDNDKKIEAIEDFENIKTTEKCVTNENTENVINFKPSDQTSTVEIISNQTTQISLDFKPSELVPNVKIENDRPDKYFAYDSYLKPCEQLKNDKRNADVKYITDDITYKPKAFVEYKKPTKPIRNLRWTENIHYSDSRKDLKYVEGGVANKPINNIKSIQYVSSMTPDKYDANIKLAEHQILYNKPTYDYLHNIRAEKYGKNSGNVKQVTYFAPYRYDSIKPVGVNENFKSELIQYNNPIYDVDSTVRPARNEYDNIGMEKNIYFHRSEK